MRVVVLCAVLGLACAAACVTTSPRPAGDETAAALKQQADAWDRAIVRKDRAAVEANVAPDFRNIDGRGTVSDRATFLADLLDPDLQIDPYTVEDFDCRLYGDVALLSGRTRMTGRIKGEAFRSHYRYIDVYVKRGGTWKVVSVQISKIAE